jgi:hypothetical protein
MMSNLSNHQALQRQNSELLTATEELQEATVASLQATEKNILSADKIAGDTIVELERQREQIVRNLNFFPFRLIYSFLSLFSRLVFLLFLTG